jgi:hypothetical protein
MESTMPPLASLLVRDANCLTCSDRPELLPYTQIGDCLPSQSKLLTICRELRDLVYNYAVQYDPREDVRPKLLGLAGTGLVPSRKLQFLLTCRQIYHEAHDLAFEATNFYLGSSLIQVVIPTTLASSLQGNKKEEKKHLSLCHDSKLHQKLIKLQPSSTTLLRTISFSVSHEITRGGIPYVFGRYKRLFLPFEELNLTKIIFYAAKDCGWGFSVRTASSFLMLIGSMESLRHISWIDSTHKRKGEPELEHFRRRFHYNFQPGSSEFEQMGAFKRPAEQMRCTPVDGMTKTAVVSARGLWCAERTAYDETSPWRDIKVTIASFEEMAALQNE